jgi:predicted esterase
MKSLEFTYKASYHTLGQLDKHTEQIWIVCHGYGQLSKYFIRKFGVLDNGKNYVIAPGGLHRFYQKGFAGRVGASWMTSEQREIDIENYLTYLNGIYEKELQEVDLNQVKINVLGFSQGAATVSRFIAQPHIRFHRLILWAGLFPPDLNMTLTQEQLKGKETLLVYGLQDSLIDHESLLTQKQIVDKLGIEAQTITFEGVHEVEPEVLKQL